jgi:hypothetical protein
MSLSIYLSKKENVMHPLMERESREYGFGYGSSFNGMDMTEREHAICTNLPHGSGIDYDWHAERRPDGRLALQNAYHGMDEYGAYVAIVEFEIVIDADDPVHFDLTIAELDFVPESWGFYYGLDEYLGDTIAYCIMDALEDK